MKLLGFKKTYTLPFQFEIPNTTEIILKKKSYPSSRIKFIKRYLYIKLKRQKLLETYNILPEHQNILWINISAPSLGDSLMDLSSRVLLGKRKIDLFTDQNNAIIYKDDDFFTSVFSNISSLGEKKYDLVIIDSFSTRSLYIKSQIALLTPFVAMFGYYNGPEVNRVLFSFHQMNKLLGYKKNETEINEISKPSIFISKIDQKIISSLDLPKSFIAIVVGGEWAFRTFNSWDLVIERLIKLDNKLDIVLIGSENGVSDANSLANKFEDYNLLNYVSKFTFNQTTELIKHAEFIICCDGGLMHAANAVDTPIVTLLAKLDSEMQLTEANICFSLYDDLNVNNISILEILNGCKQAFNFVHNRLPNE